MTSTATAQITAPAERILPGLGRQLVNTFDDKGNFLHQTSHRGTERQARAKGLLRTMHDTDPGFAIAVAALRGTE